MKWLHNDGRIDGQHGGDDEALARLRTGLDLAAERTDELALRRVWARLQEIPMGQRRQVRPLVLGCTLVMAAGAAAAVFATMLRVPELAPATHAPAPLARAPYDFASPSLVSVPVLLGPATLQTGERETKQVRLRGGAVLAVSPRSTLVVDAGQRPRISHGRVRLEVPRQPPGEQFTVEAGPYMIVVVGTKFDVTTDDRQVDVVVKEGVVEVWRDGQMVRLSAGDTWQGLVVPQPEAAPAPKQATHARPAVNPSWQQIASERFEEAQRALATGDTSYALEILRALAEGKGATAENASYEVGLVLRDRLNQPREAMNAWKRYQERFPRGLLRAEADLSVVETQLNIGDMQAALEEAEAFLRRHPNSERQAELRELVQRLRTVAASAPLDEPAPAQAP